MGADLTVTRKLDDLGRVVIPGDFRSHLGWQPGADVDITLDYSGKALLIRINSATSEDGDA